MRGTTGAALIVGCVLAGSLVASGSAVAVDPGKPSDEGWHEETQIAECMAARGFEYHPWLHGGWLREDVNDQAAREGWSDERINAALADIEDPVDPNTAVFEQMSLSDQERYNDALDGADGCRTGVFQDAMDQTAEQMAKDQQDALELWASVLADPAVIEAAEEYVRCMKRAGYDIDDQNDFLNQYGGQGSVVADLDEETMLAVQAEAFAADTTCFKQYVEVEYEVYDRLAGISQ